MEVNNLEERSKIEINGTTVRLSHAAREYTIVDSMIVARLIGWCDTDVEMWERIGIDMSHEKETPDFELETSYRNVVGFTAEADPEWVIPDAPHDPPADDDPYYMGLWTIDDELWVRNKNQRSYRVDPTDGTLLEDIPADQFRLGGRTIEFDRGWVDQVIYHEGLVIVRLDGSGHPGPSGKNIYVFNEDGTRRWWLGERLEDPETPAPPFTNIWIEEGLLGGYTFDGYEYLFDPDDGTLLDETWVK